MGFSLVQWFGCGAEVQEVASSNRAGTIGSTKRWQTNYCYTKDQSFSIYVLLEVKEPLLWSECCSKKVLPSQVGDSIIRCSKLEVSQGINQPIKQTNKQASTMLQLLKQANCQRFNSPRTGSGFSSPNSLFYPSSQPKIKPLTVAPSSCPNQR